MYSCFFHNVVKSLSFIIHCKRRGVFYFDVEHTPEVLCVASMLWRHDAAACPLLRALKHKTFLGNGFLEVEFVRRELSCFLTNTGALRWLHGSIRAPHAVVFVLNTAEHCELLCHHGPMFAVVVYWFVFLRTVFSKLPPATLMTGPEPRWDGVVLIIISVIHLFHLLLFESQLPVCVSLMLISKTSHLLMISSTSCTSNYNNNNNKTN